MTLTEIAPEFSFVLDKGFLQIERASRPQDFGNASIVLEGPTFSLRIIRDRGQVFADVGDDSVGWHRLENVLGFIDPLITQQLLREPPDTARMASLLSGNWERIGSVFRDRTQLDKLQQFGERRSAEFLRRIFPSPKA